MYLLRIWKSYDDWVAGVRPTECGNVVEWNAGVNNTWCIVFESGSMLLLPNAELVIQEFKLEEEM